MKELKIEVPEGYEIDEKNSTFEKIIFKPLEENKYPETWEDCIKLLKNKGTSFAFIHGNSDIGIITSPKTSSRDFNLLPSKEDAKKFLTLQKLYTCRQAYIGNWKPDWINFDISKYIITASKNKLTINTHYSDNRSFSFPTFEMAEEFPKNFKDLLEEIKLLL